MFAKKIMSKKMQIQSGLGFYGASFYYGKARATYFVFDFL
jgi:hypothetical protein